MARCYGALLGWEVTARDEPDARLGGTGWIAMRDPAGGPGLSFQAEEWYEPPVWPERPGSQTKQVHLEVAVADLDAAVALVVGAGGRLAEHQPVDRDPRSLRVVLDPAGHPLCLCLDDAGQVPG